MIDRRRFVSVVTRALPILLLGAATACGSDDSAPAAAPPPIGYSFSGRVYDGVTGEQLTRYTASLDYADTTLPASVDSAGVYYVGALPGGNDFTVEVDGMNYRPFLSHNAQLPPTGVDVSYYYDAYLFPADVLSPAATLTITAPDGTTPLAGNVSLRPTGSSSLYASPTDQPAGVPGQVWVNDEDLQAGAVSAAFTSGTVTLAQGQLVYGVTYAVTVYGVAGLQPATATFTSGVDSSLTIPLQAQATASATP
jgi:hypothetical protein